MFERERHAMADAEPTKEPERDPNVELETREIIAYHPTAEPAIEIRPAARKREWIDQMADRCASRCLPLMVASEAASVLLYPLAFEAVWSGDPRPSGLVVSFDEDPADHPPVQSHFGYGILTWA